VGRGALALVLVSGTTSLHAEPAGGVFSFDAFVFSQEDEGAQAFRAEGFGYGGVRLALFWPRSEATAFRATAAIARIDNDALPEFPATIGNANVTSASPSVLTLDATFGWDLQSPGSPWSLHPGVTYHHQARYLGGGPDMTVRGRLFEGDVLVTGTLAARFASTELDYWDGSERGHDVTMSLHASFAWSQNLSPSFVLEGTARLVQQTGYLADPFNYVVLSSDAGAPVRLADEVLPRSRARAQVGVGIRASPRRGTSTGVEASFYADDWDVRSIAFEPSVVLPFTEGRARFWYRLTVQEPSRYFEPVLRRATVGAMRYRTQDGDLGEFTMHGGGTSLEWPLGAPFLGGWISNTSLFGFHRDDGLSGLGGQIGLAARW